MHDISKKKNHRSGLSVKTSGV